MCVGVRAERVGGWVSVFVLFYSVSPAFKSGVCVACVWSVWESVCACGCVWTCMVCIGVCGCM